MRDSEILQLQADRIVSALDRAGCPWNREQASGGLRDGKGLEEMRKAHDDFEAYGKALRAVGEHEIADQYFRFPAQLGDLWGYLPK